MAYLCEDNPQPTKSKEKERNLLKTPKTPFGKIAEIDTTEQWY